MMKKVILASASKRRSEILNSCGISHEIVPSDVEEVMEDACSISEIVQMNAIMKADRVAETIGKDKIIIAADTLVKCGDMIVGKPKDEAEAKKMLIMFSGRYLEVHTGICVIDTSTGEKSAGVDTSDIRVAAIKEKDAEKYFRLLGPYDKAGGFSIEGIGSMLFDNIFGSYFNILGLSMMKLRDLFDEIGLDILDYVDRSKI